MLSRYDIKQSFARLYRDYQYSAAVIITMALTLAIALFLFTMVYTVKYKPLPMADAPENIVWATLNTNGRAYGLGGLTNYNYQYLTQHLTSLDYLGRTEQRSATLSNDQFTEQRTGVAVSHTLFPMLGITPILGRGLLPSDDVLGEQKHLVISYRLWDELFNKDEHVVNQIIRLNGEAATIVGVMPKGFHFPTRHDFWFSDALLTETEESHGGWNSIFGRLKPNTTLADVQAEVDLLMDRMRNNYPNQYKGKVIEVVSFTQRFTQYMQFLLAMLSIAGVAILLMGCFSVANLIIVRNLENAKEVLIKTALGVPVVRIIAGLLLETFWVCVIATAIGIWLCFLAIHFVGEGLLNGPYWWVLEFQWPILWIGLCAALFVWLSTGVIPVWMSARQPTNGLLSSGRKGGTGTTLTRLMAGFSALQIFSAFILMVFTGVLMVGLMRIMNADYGVPKEGFLTAEIMLQGEAYSDLAERNHYYDRLLERVKQIDGVIDASVASAVPGDGGYLANFTSTERTIEVNGTFPQANEMPAHEDYFKVMEIPLLEGRHFNRADVEGAEEVAVISRSMAELLFPGESALGRQFQYNPEQGGKLITVVGVVPEVVSGNPLWFLSPASKYWRSQLYRPMRQMQPIWDSNTLVFKTDRNPYDLVDAVKAAAREIDSEVPLFRIMSFEDALAENESGFRSMIATFLPAALLALVVSALGLYSITRRVVLQSTPDIGIMRALGIAEGHINWRYLRGGLVQMAVAVCAGVAFSLWVLPRLPDSIIIANMQSIAVACAVVTILVVGIVWLASFTPMRKAHKLSPREAMNYLSLNNE